MYKIITDLPELEGFLSSLPVAEKDEKFYVALFARKKYTDDPRFRADKTQLKRIVTTADRLV